MHVGTVALLVLDDLVLAMMVGDRNDGGAGPTGVPSIGVASTHPSSSLSRSIESDDEIVREKPTTAVVLCEIGPVVIAAVALGVVSPTGSSSVPPLL